MIGALKFVQGAVAKKDFVAALTHFRIKNGLVKGYNGVLALCSPIDQDLDISPQAVPFIKAIRACGEDSFQLHVTPKGRLAIKSGSFKTFVDCISEEFPDVEPEGEMVALNGGLLAALKILAPFIGIDDTRKWARGVLFKGQSAVATNNIAILEYWLGYNFPVVVNVPQPAVTELLRIGEEPTALQLSERSVTFHFAEGRWLRTQTLDLEWPDLAAVLDQPSEQKALPPGLFEAVETLHPFVDELGHVFFYPGRIACVPVDTEGATITLDGIDWQGCYNFKNFLMLKDVAKTIDFGAYPRPCLFYGDRVRGALIGMRT